LRSKLAAQARFCHSLRIHEERDAAYCTRGPVGLGPANWIPAALMLAVTQAPVDIGVVHAFVTGPAIQAILALAGAIRGRGHVLRRLLIMSRLISS